MSKMGSHDPFGYLKRKLWSKEGSEVKLPIWFPTTKSWKLPWFPCVQVTCTYCQKDLDEGYNFALDLTLIKGLHTKLWAYKVAKVSILRISGLSSGSHGTNWHLGVSPVARHKEYYKREGGGFPRVHAVMSLVNPCLLMTHMCTKGVSITY